MLSFRRTTRTRALARFVESAYAAAYVRADGARGGGDTKRAALTLHGGRGARGLTVRARGPGRGGERLNALLREVESVCRRHYARMDFRALDRRYGPPHPGARPQPQGVEEACEEDEETGELDAHGALLVVFAKYAGEPDAHGRTVRWSEAEAERTECDLLEVAEAERRKKRSSSQWFESSESTNWWGIKDESEDEDEDEDVTEPLLKKRKIEQPDGPQTLAVEAL